MDPKNFVDVPQIDLFAFIAGLPERPALIKMDIEGAEWPILERVMTGERPFDALFVETHERFNPWRDMPRLNRFRRFAETCTDAYLNAYWH